MYLYTNGTNRNISGTAKKVASLQAGAFVNMNVLQRSIQRFTDTVKTMKKHLDQNWDAMTKFLDSNSSFQLKPFQHLILSTLLCPVVDKPSSSIFNYEILYQTISKDEGTYSNAFKKYCKRTGQATGTKKSEKGWHIQTKTWLMKRPSCMMSSQNYRETPLLQYSPIQPWDVTLNIRGLSTTKMFFTKVMSYQ